MTETTDDIRPLGAGGRLSPVALARVAAKVIGIVTPAIVAALISYRTAAGDTQVRVQGTKDKAEAGYQETRHAVEELQGREVDLQKRVVALEQLVHRLEAQGRRGAARKPPVPQPAPAPPAPPAKKLPNDLDQAERQIYRGAPPAPGPRGDAAP